MQRAGCATCQLDIASSKRCSTADLRIPPLRSSEHITDTLASVHWLHVPERILFKVAVLTYRALNGSAPAYLSSYFTRVAASLTFHLVRSSTS